MAQEPDCLGSMFDLGSITYCVSLDSVSSSIKCALKQHLWEPGKD